MSWLIGSIVCLFFMRRLTRYCSGYSFDSAFWLALLQSNSIVVHKMLLKGASQGKISSKHIHAYLERMPPVSLKPLQEIEDVIHSIPRNSYSYYLLAHTYLSLKIPTAAYRYFQKAGAKSNFPIKVALSFIRQKYHKEALDWIQQCAVDGKCDYTSLLKAYIYSLRNSKGQMQKELESLDQGTKMIDSVRYLEHKWLNHKPLLSVNIRGAKTEYLYRHGLYRALLLYIDQQKPNKLACYELKIAAMASYRLKRVNQSLSYISRLGALKPSDDIFVMSISYRVVSMMSSHELLCTATQIADENKMIPAIALAITIRILQLGSFENKVTEVLKGILSYLSYPELMKIVVHMQNQIDGLEKLSDKNRAQLCLYWQYHMKNLIPKLSIDSLLVQRRIA